VFNDMLKLREDAQLLEKLKARKEATKALLTMV
jgi:hypothetical protein